MNSLSLLDSNIILRFLIADELEQLKQVKQLLKSTDNFYIHDVIFSEIIWVAIKFYKLEKTSVVGVLTDLVELPNIFCDKLRILKALEIWETHSNTSFVDAYILASGVIDKNEALYTFDKDLLKAKVDNLKLVRPV